MFEIRFGEYMWVSIKKLKHPSARPGQEYLQADMKGKLKKVVKAAIFVILYSFPSVVPFYPFLQAKGLEWKCGERVILKNRL